ncbi:MAG: type II toxin-antitoxin system HicB family antitoxin [Gloeotrichia echinulata GP01]
MGQLIEWLEVVTEGETLEECRTMLQDATREMILAYRQQNKEIPTGIALPIQMRYSIVSRDVGARHCRALTDVPH